MTISLSSLASCGCSGVDDVNNVAEFRLEWQVGSELTESTEADLRRFYSLSVDADSWGQRYALVSGDEGIDQALASFRSGSCHLLLARDAKGACVGVLDLHVQQQENEAEVGIIIAQHQRGRGHGTRMAEEAEAFARSKGLHRLVALPQGMGVSAFLGKLGFSAMPRHDGRHERLLPSSSSAGLGLTDKDLECIVF